MNPTGQEPHGVLRDRKLCWAKGMPGGHSIPSVRSGSLPEPQLHPVSKDRGCCWQSSGSATSPCRGDEVISVASMNYDPIVSKVAEVLASGRTIRKREVE